MNEQTIASLALIDSASTAESLAGACAGLAKGLGLTHFFFVHRSGFNQLGLVCHNAGSTDFLKLLPLANDSCDPLVERPRSSRIPFFWSGEDYASCDEATLAAYQARAMLGFRSGVCAPAIGAGDQSIVLVLGWEQARVPDHDPIGIHGPAFMGAISTLVAASRIAVANVIAPRLTQRELDCLLYVLAGASAKITARELSVAPRSVHQYLERARKRLGTENSFQAALIAVRAGLIDPNEAKRIGASISPDVGQT